MHWSQFGAPDAPARSRLLPGITGMIVDSLALIGEVAVGRSRMGRRYLTIWGVAAGYLLLMGFPWVLTGLFAYLFSSAEIGLVGGLFMGYLASRLPWTQGTIWFTAFTWSYLGRSVWLLLEVDSRKRAGEPIPSTYSGIPSPLWSLIPYGSPLTEGQIKRYGEPAVLLLVAYGIHTTDLLLALYLGTSGLALFLKGQLEHRILSHQAADLEDQLLDSENLAAPFGGTATSPQPQGVAQPAAMERWTAPASDRPEWAATAANQPTLINTPLPETVRILDDWYLTDEPADAPTASSTVTVQAPASNNVAVQRVKVRCPHCGQIGKVPFRQGPRTLLCHGCDRQFQVSDSSAPPSQ